MLVLWRPQTFSLGKVSPSSPLSPEALSLNPNVSTTNSRYGWDISIRMDDIMLAWAKVERKETAPQKKEEKSKEVLTTKASTGNSSSIPIVMKASSIDKVLLCQLDDPDLHFSGDSGAIGRFVCNPESLRLDLKGRQYKGTLTSGPTIFILNLSNPQSAKVETVTNEFCHLTFERDQHSSLQGVYSGAGGAGGGLNYDDSALDDIVPLHRQKSKGNDDNEDSTTQANAPKISTITNKKRRQSSTKTTAKKKSKK